MYFYS